jgi:hypothetical protein
MIEDLLGIKLFHSPTDDEGEWGYIDPTCPRSTFSGFETKEQAIEDFMLQFGLGPDSLQRIQSLRAERDRLREALIDIDALAWDDDESFEVIVDSVARIARKALEGGTP